MSQEHSASNASTTSSRPTIRWWPAILIGGLTVVGLAAIWFGDASQLQDRVVPTIMVVGLASIALALWLFLFSRLPWGTRGRCFVALLALGAVAAGLFEIQGFSGDLVPDIRFRWGSQNLQTEATAAAAAIDTSPTDYPQFLGPQRNGVVTDLELATDWQTQPPKELWRQSVGDAWSSFAVVGPALLTQEQRDDQEAVARYDLATGDLVWVSHYPGQFESVLGGNGPRATPTVVGDRVYTVGSGGVLSSWQLADGKLVWQRDLVQEHGASIPEWGYAGSPLVLTENDLATGALGESGAGGMVIVGAGGPDGHSVAAYGTADGNLLWHAGDDPASYASPVLLEILGVPNVVVRHLGSVSGHDPVDGRILWSVDWPGQQPNVAQPLLLGNDRLLLSSGYGVGSRLFRFSLDADGRLLPEMAWESLRMKAKFTNMVEHGGAVFGLDDGILVSLDPETGERHWKKGRYGHGQLLLVDEHLLILSEKGDVVLVEANPEAYREVTRFTALGDKSWNTPALSGRHLLVRNAGEAACFELPLKG